MKDPVDQEKTPNNDDFHFCLQANPLLINRKVFLRTCDSNYVPIIVRLQHIYNLLFDLNQKLPTGRKNRELTEKSILAQNMTCENHYF